MFQPLEIPESLRRANFTLLRIITSAEDVPWKLLSHNANVKTILAFMEAAGLPLPETNWRTVDKSWIGSVLTPAVRPQRPFAAQLSAAAAVGSDLANLSGEIGLSLWTTQPQGHWSPPRVLQ
jgi:hypothetical protein